MNVTIPSADYWLVCESSLVQNLHLFQDRRLATFSRTWQVKQGHHLNDDPTYLGRSPVVGLMEAKRSVKTSDARSIDSFAYLQPFSWNLTFWPPIWELSEVKAGDMPTR